MSEVRPIFSPFIRRFLTPLAILTTVCLWASAHVAVRAVLLEEVYDPYRLALLRYLVASLVLLSTAFWLRVRVPLRRDLPRIALAGALGVSAYNALLNLGQSMMQAGSASFIVNTIPLFTALLSMLFLGERLGRWGWGGMVLSLVGVTLIGLGEGEGLAVNRGTLVILIAAMAWSGAAILHKPMLSRYRAIEIATYSTWSGALWLLVFLPGLWSQISTAQVSDTIIVTYLGVFPAALAYLCWAHALSRMPASRAASFLYAIPVLTVVIAYFWMGEIPSWLALAGGALALTGVVLVNLRGHRNVSGQPAVLPARR